MPRPIRLLVILLLSLCVVSCSGGGDGETSDAGGSSAAPAVGEGDVAARVKDAVITVPEVRRVAENMLRQGAPADTTVGGDTEAEQMYRTAMARLIEQRVVEAAAIDQGITVDTAQVQSTISQYQVSAGGAEAFEEMLAANGVTMDDVRRDVRSNLYVRQYFSQAMPAQPTVEDAEIETWYAENQDRFGPQAEVKARHILVRITPEMDDMARATARQQAEEARARVASGEDFATVAGEVSEDPQSKINGGDLGWFRKETMVGPFSEAAFALEPGQMSEVVETQFGYHVIQVDERRMSEGQSLDQVRNNVRMMLSQQKMQERYQAIIDSLKSGYDVRMEPVEEADLQGLGS
jgi:peptidyl-prolyl cis-trans isomerase C